MIVMFSKSFLFVTIVTLFFTNYTTAQIVHLDYILDATNVEVPNSPSLGLSPPTNYDNIQKPLVVEGYADDDILTISSDIHVLAGDFSVYSGGTLPNSMSNGILAPGWLANPIYTKQTFDSCSFPITIRGTFYNFNSSTSHNESYLWIGPADYTYYTAPTIYYPDSHYREGIVIGGYPNEMRIINNYSANATSQVIKILYATPAAYATWFNLEATFDIIDNNFYVTQVKVNDVVTESLILLGNINNFSWLKNVRLAICVDDLAHRFEIFYKSNTSVDCDDSNPLTIDEYDASLCTCLHTPDSSSYDNNIKANFSANALTICENQCIVFSDQSTNAIAWQWIFEGSTSPYTSNIPNPEPICYSTPGTYNVQLITTNSLGNTDTLLKENYISVFNDCDNSLIIEPKDVILFSNAFTPNNDNLNETFFTIKHTEQINSIYISVYNRWGEKIFTTQLLSDIWDGTYKGEPCEMGIYVYSANIHLKNGNQQTFKGNITLIR